MFEKFKEKIMSAAKRVCNAAKKIWNGIIDILSAWSGKAFNYVKEHPLEAATTVGTLFAGYKKLHSMRLDYIEEDRRHRDFYDPRTGKHVWARRKLTTRELMRIDARYKAGDSYTQILADMGLLAR